METNTPDLSDFENQQLLNEMMERERQEEILFEAQFIENSDGPTRRRPTTSNGKYNFCTICTTLEKVHFVHNLCIFFSFLIDDGSGGTAKRRKIQIFETDLETVKTNLSSKSFAVKDNSGKASFWKSYQNVVTTDGVHTNYVKCRFCGRIDKYDTKNLGSKSLTIHADKCNTILRPIDSYIKRKDVTITAEEKKILTQAVVFFCCIDIRPFTAIQCAGIIQFLVVFSAIVAKYGRLNEKEIRAMLPCPNAVNYFKRLFFCEFVVENCIVYYTLSIHYSAYYIRFD